MDPSLDDLADWLSQVCRGLAATLNDAGEEWDHRLDELSDDVRRAAHTAVAMVKRGVRDPSRAMECTAKFLDHALYTSGMLWADGDSVRCAMDEFAESVLGNKSPRVVRIEVDGKRVLVDGSPVHVFARGRRPVTTAARYGKWLAGLAPEPGSGVRLLSAGLTRDKGLRVEERSTGWELVDVATGRVVRKSA